MEEIWIRQLDAGLAALELPLAEDQKRQLIAYLGLLHKWNKAFNLTAVRDPSQLVDRHLLDSLEVAPWVRGPRVLDVGSGAGLPGIPLAIAFPEWQFVLLDSNGKKTRFLNQTRIELGLSNLSVVQDRVESYRQDELFSTVVSRAFAALGDFWRQASHLIVPGGRWLAMKGRYPAEELAELKWLTAAPVEVIALSSGPQEGARTLVIVDLPAG